MKMAAEMTKGHRGCRPPRGDPSLGRLEGVGPWDPSWRTSGFCRGENSVCCVSPQGVRFAPDAPETEHSAGARGDVWRHGRPSSVRTPAHPPLTLPFPSAAGQAVHPSRGPGPSPSQGPVSGPPQRPALSSVSQPLVGNAQGPPRVPAPSVGLGEVGGVGNSVPGAPSSDGEATAECGVGVSRPQGRGAAWC